MVFVDISFTEDNHIEESDIKGEREILLLEKLHAPSEVKPAAQRVLPWWLTLSRCNVQQSHSHKSQVPRVILK